MFKMTEIFSATAESCGQFTPEAMTDYCSGLVREMVESDHDATPRKQKFHRAARDTGLTDGQVKRLFYGEWSAIPAHVFLAVQSAYRHHLDRARRRAEHQAALYRDLSERWDNECAGSSTGKPQKSSGSPASFYSPHSV